MNSRTRFALPFALLLSAILPTQVIAWGEDGHRVVGALSLDFLDKSALQALHRLLGTEDADAIVQWCNWPDEYRSTDEGEWTYPLHFINMVPGASLYEMERDCPTGMCVTEAIGKFSAQLGNPELDLEKRQQAFGFVCHFVGDMHQPLHAGFGHDRGGNDFEITFKDEVTNIHHFWDRALILDRSDSWQSLYDLLSDRSGPNPKADWDPVETVVWTNESHAFAETLSYPENPVITDEFADRSWRLAGEQMKKGGFRLARVLNTVLGGSESSDESGHSKKRKCKPKSE